LPPLLRCQPPHQTLSVDSEPPAHARGLAVTRSFALDSRTKVTRVMTRIPASNNVSTKALQIFLRFALLLPLTAPSLSAQNTTPPPEKRGRLESLVTRFQYAHSVPGISAAAVLDGQPVWSEGFGVADLENFVPATSSTLYRLGSISKPITAVAAMQLWENGKLDLDAPIQKYCPAFPQKQAPITTRQLLGHLGGIRHYNPDGKGDVPDDSAHHFGNMEESLQLFANDPLLAQPGTEFHYSTYGYTLIGCVLEGAASQRYMDYLHNNVLVPAGMYETQADNFFAVVQHRTRWYHQDKSGVVRNAGVLDSSYKIPGGGLISSADDMAKFAAAMLADSLVKPATRELMWAEQRTTDGKSTRYGLGWGITDKFSLHLVAHDGGQQGTSTAMILAPGRRAAILVLCNMDNVAANQIAEDLLRVLLDLDQKGP
jgi:serine beta-lactamase-like protein LACTB, mitochondrial